MPIPLQATIILHLVPPAHAVYSPQSAVCRTIVYLWSVSRFSSEFYAEGASMQKKGRFKRSVSEKAKLSIMRY